MISIAITSHLSATMAADKIFNFSSEFSGHKQMVALAGTADKIAFYIKTPLIPSGIMGLGLVAYFAQANYLGRSIIVRLC